MHQAPERPKDATAFGRQSFPPSCERQILAGKRGPCHLNWGGKLFGCNARNIPEHEMVLPEILGIDLGFLWGNVVGPGTLPGFA
jgi:hypothetical protein